MKTFLHIGNCPIRDVLSHLGDKWSLLVLLTLSANGTMRFSDVQKSLGDISQRMLTVTLRSLESDGLVVRKIYPEIPPRVEYALTERGKSLMPHLTNLINWALSNMQEVIQSRTGRSQPPSSSKKHKRSGKKLSI